MSGMSKYADTAFVLSETVTERNMIMLLSDVFFADQENKLLIEQR